MSEKTPARIWRLMLSVMQEFWAITEPFIEDAAVQNEIPIELYYYSELGSTHFSVEEFQKRDPFTNPEQFEKAFARFEVKGWIFPLPDERYQVSAKAQGAVRMIVNAGDAQLSVFHLMPEDELRQIVRLLKQLLTAMIEADEPPAKWAFGRRFHVTDANSPLIVQARELLMDIFAYRDDAYLSAARPHFGQAGIVWEAFDSIVSGAAINAAQMAETLSFRGYEAEDYEIAIHAAVEIGWVEAKDATSFLPTAKGRQLYEEVKHLTDDYFYRSWSALTEEELENFHTLLAALHERLIEFRKQFFRNGRIGS
ncbi:MAG: hypothetical protein HXY42_06730 [Chloroflexi bacterium]|nr:hypothetical protein [Chloroflexota bacterium]